MKTQKTMEFAGPDIPQPDAYEALARLKGAHEVVEWFQRDKQQQMAAIRRMLDADSRLTTADQIKEPNL